ncbi:non-ribosomal peptide synthetase [Chitinophaga vietnamensis]|uniref:non-ribosomal peptide synthetase n=1 Tax=Chitinophaga vietnamensis TaxID=2593957 RepID=UPI00117855E1|nr:non-ribosomal peptide synthetase [Chitinophaga vietnamensis]
MSEITLQEYTTTSYWTDKIKRAGGASFYNKQLLPASETARQQYRLPLAAGLSDAVVRTSKDKDLNIYKLAMAALYILLGKYSQRPELLLTTSTIRLDAGVPASNPALLFFTVPYDDGMTVRDLLKQVHAELEANISRQQYDYPQLYATLQQRTDWAEYAFSTAFAYEPVSILQDDLYKTDILFLLTRKDDQLEWEIDYNAHRYDEVEVMLLGAHLTRILEQISHDLSLKIDDLNCISSLDHHYLFGAFNDTAVSFREQPVIEQFESQALLTPDAIAVKSGPVTLTYRELNERANRVAWHLKQERGLPHQAKVALMVNRSEKIIIGIIGILKAGGVYIPIDLSSPQERVRFFLEDSGCPIVLTEKSLIEQTPDAAQLGYVAIDELSDGSPDNPLVNRDPHELAYMIYTSGTTGKPKGAMVHHLGLANHVSWYRKRFAITPADSTMLINSYSFDGCYSYIWATLTSGATLHVPNDSYFDPEKTLQYIKQEQVTFLKMVPSTFGVLVNSATFDEDPEVCRSVRIIKQGGETINVKNLRKYFERYPHVELGNHYGATEATIGSVAHWINKDTIDDFARQPVLGKPFDNQRVYVLNSRGELLPIGVPGEICIGGIGVGKGYHQREELTARKFINDPFTPGGRLYRTGDHGRWLPSGALEFFGRIDNQVKIRGYRIELDEVAETLKASPAVRDAIVMVYNKDGQDQLAAYIVADETPDIAALQEFIKSRLPEYMIPVYYVPLARIPLTPNGKIDKRALPDASEYRAQFQGQAVAARNAVEAQLVAVWESLLDINGVGVTDNFFEIGGHSLKATQLVALIHKKMQVLLPLREVFLHPTIEEQAQLIGTGEQQAFADIEPVALQEDYALSHAQQRMWLMASMEQDQTVYNIPHAAILEGELDIAAFEKALQALVARHEVLRTVFVQRDGEPRQRVLPASGFALAYKDLQHAPQSEEAAAAIAAAEASTVFNLERGPLVRAVLLQLAPQRFTFLFTLHHIISDGWSTQVFFSEILQLYYAFHRNESSPLEALKIQYKDFAAWQNALLAGDEGRRHRDYWLQQLGGNRPVLELPADFSRPRVMTYKGDYISTCLPLAVQQKLQQYAAANQLSVYMVLMAAVKTLLYRYTGQQDLIVGTPVAGREHASLANQIGFYVNTLAVRTQIPENISFDQFVKDGIRHRLLEAYQHQAYPFDQLIDDLSLERDMSRSPLFNVMVVMQNNSATRDALLEMNQLRATPFSNQAPQSKFDLTIDFEESKDGLVLGIEYYADLFARPRIVRMLGHLANIITAIADDPGIMLEEIDYLSEDEQREIASFNGQVTPIPLHLTVHGVFEQVARARPDAMALEDEQHAYTYAQLHAYTDQLATLLQQRGVSHESVVAVVMTRSADFVIGMLATLKAGAAYMPVESNTPVERIAQLLQQTNAAIVLTNDARIRQHFEQTIYLPEVELPLAAIQSFANADSLAYIMFTSGTTGRPKGVMITHRSIVSLLTNPRNVYITAEDRMLQTGSLSFDAATLEIWGALLNGATIYMMELQRLLDPASMAEVLREKAITTAFFTTSWLNQLIDHDPQLFAPMRTIYSGGEQLSVSHVRRLLAQLPALKFYNIYGPTEITVFVTKNAVHEDAEVTATIGYPVENGQVFIVDRHGRPVPKGIPGEALLGGEGLSRGYINDEARTLQQFIRRGTQRLYRSGDQARWLEDGRIEFTGRIDEQVKIRGYRVEPEEITNVLLSHPDVKEAIVIVHKQADGNKLLAAYYTLTGTATREAIRQYLEQQLPAYMVPASLIQLEVMPLNANGKTDRSALPEPELSGADYVPARNETEQQLVGIWERLLGVSRVGIYDNFFALGGHSLLATRLVSAIREEMQAVATVKDVFLHQTIAAFAPLLAGAAKATLPPLSRHHIDKAPLSFAQERLWFIDQLEGSVPYHMPVLLRLKGALDTSALAHALHALVERHEVLRTVLKEEGGKAYQQIISADGWQLDTSTDINIDPYIHQPFDLSKDFMLRARLIALQEDEHQLLIVMHHIATDGWSMGIIIRELTELYTAYTEQRSAQLPELPVQYKDIAIWQRQYLSGEVLDRQLQYWKQQLDDVTPLHLLTDYVRPALQSTKGAHLLFNIDPQLTAQLQQLSLQQGTTLFMTLLAAFKVLLHRYTGQDDIAVGSPIAGRTQQEAEALIGFFVNTLVLRSRLDGNPSFTAFLQQVKHTTLQAYEHQEVPFEKVVDQVVTSRELSRSPLFQAVFALQNTPRAEGASLGQLQLTEEDIDQTTAKTDISFSLEETPAGLQGNVVYCTDLFRRETIEQLLRHFRQLLQAIAAAPDAAIGALQFLSAEDEQQFHQFNEKVPGFELDMQAHIVSRFRQQVQAQPAGIALCYDNITLSYQTLDERSNQFAHYLRKLGVEGEMIVPICLDRSPEMIIAILGVLKAGGAYLPIDPAYPQDRIQYTLQDSGAQLLITTTSCEAQIECPSHIQVIRIDTGVYLQEETSSLDAALDGHHLAYVIYTSGSTGRPKGVLLEHRGIVNLVQGHVDVLQLRPGKRMLQFSSFGFDASCYEIFNTLLSGGTLILPKQEELMSVDSFEEMINRYQVEMVVLPPSYQHAIREKTGSIRTMVSAGEALHVDDARYLQEKGIRLLNGYGPTENTICATISDNPLLPHAVTIGPSIANVQAYIVDRYNNLCPVGVAGELCVGGYGVARGYLNRPDLTKEKFVQGIFDKGICYRTGDQARWLPDGNIEFLGRIDDQVKIRGYRIEPGEVTAVLQQCPLVNEAIVVARNNSRHKMRLVAYVVPKGRFDREAVVSFLKGRLPEYMLPSQYVEMSALPVTASGKIDKRALPSPDDHVVGAYAAPRNETEQALVAIWQELLRVQGVGIYDNFFELGGDSIITIQLVSQARRRGYLLHPRDIFLHQHIAALAGVVTSSREIQSEQGMLNGEAGILPIQQWFFEQNFAAPHHFNQAVLLNIDKSLDAAQLNTVAAALASRHDALRFRYRQEGAQWIQEYGYLLPVVAQEEAATTNEITAICERWQQQLDINTGELWHCVLIKTPLADAYNRLFIVVHHLAIDGVSWRILLEDIAAFLPVAAAGQALQTAPKTTSYRQWQQAIARYATDPATLAQLAYWQTTVKAYTPLPGAAIHVLRKDTQTHTVTLPEQDTRLLLGKAQQAYNTGINDWLLAALTQTISNWSAQPQVLITLEGHGREAIAPDLDTSQTVGWFTNMYPALLSAGNIPDIKEQLRALPGNGLGYGALRYLHPDAAVRESLQLPAMDLLFNYLGQLDNIIHTGVNVSLADEPTGEAVSGNNAFGSKLEVTASVAEGQLYVSWTYAPAQYDAALIAQLAENYLAFLQAQLQTAAALEAPVPTPSDYGLGGLVTPSTLHDFLYAMEEGQARKSLLESLYVASPLQYDMWSSSQSAPDAGTWIIQVSADIPSLDKKILQEAWNAVAAKHSIFRTAFYQLNDTLVQAVYREISVPVYERDYSHLSNEAVNIFLQKDRNTDFDMDTAPLMRITLVQMHGGITKMVWTAHHIIMDGWSMPVVVDEWMKAYEALLKGDAIADSRDRYEDYIRFINAAGKDAAAAFWREQLQDVSAPMWLPFVNYRGDRNRVPGAYNDVRLVLDESLTAAVHRFAQEQHVTVNTVIQGVWASLLFKYTRRRQVVYGVTVSTRPAEVEQVESRVGPYMSIIPLKAVMAVAQPLDQWLRDLQDHHSQARHHPYIGAADLRNWTGMEEDLFDSVLFFENYPLGDVTEKENPVLDLQQVQMHEHNNYLLSVFVGIGEEMVVRFNYNSTLLSDTCANIVSHHFRAVLLQMLRNPQTPATRIRLTTPAHLKKAFKHTGIGQRKRIPASKVQNHKS